MSAGILADNFLDAAHFPFLHAGTFGADDDGKPTLTVSRDGWRVQQIDLQTVDGAHLEAAEPTHAVYTVAAPFTVELRLDRTGGERLHLVVRVPGRRRHVGVVDGARLPARRRRRRRSPARCALQTQVGVEDLWMLEQMEDPTIPLDIRAEVHTKADAGCLEYRRMLIDLVHAVGASDASTHRSSR